MFYEQFLTERTWRSSGSGTRRKGSRPSATPGDHHDDHEGEHDDHDLTIIMMLMVVKMVIKCMTFIFISNYWREAESPCSCQSNRNGDTSDTCKEFVCNATSNRTQLAKVITFYSNQFSCARGCKNAKTTILCFVTTWGQFSQSLARHEVNRNLGKFCLKKQHAQFTLS